MPQQTKKAKLFLSYARPDAASRDQLVEHLAVLHRQGYLDTWYDEQIVAGQPWAEEIEARLESSDIILLLVSPSFLASQFCYDVEMQRALQRHRERTAHVVPVILRPCDWQASSLGTLKVLPGDGQPIVSRADEDTAFLEVVQGLRDIVEAFQAGQRGGTEPPQPAYASDEIRHLTQQLDAAYRQRADLLSKRGDPALLDATIVGIKQQLRSGPQLQAGDLLKDGRFQLLDSIADGGFATVWKAYDRERHELVAVKILHYQFVNDESRRTRFFRGARYMAQLRHPAIATVYETECEDGGYYFFVMEYVAGGNFRQAVLAGKLSTEERLQVIYEIGDALQHAHDQGIVHRDVKPANILLDPDGHAKLTDFDLIRAADTTGGTRTGGMMGTFLYAAPEALMDAKQSSKPADVYGLGMTAVFALHGAGLPPATFFDVSPVIDDLDVNPECRNVLKRSVAREVGERWESPREFCAELARAAVWDGRSQENAGPSEKTGPESTSSGEAPKPSERGRPGGAEKDNVPLEEVYWRERFGRWLRWIREMSASINASLDRGLIALRQSMQGEGRWLVMLMVLLPTIFILFRVLGMDQQVMLLTLLGLLAIFGLVWGLGYFKKIEDRKRARQFENDLGRHVQEPVGQAEIRDALSETSDQWKGALRELKEAHLSVYKLPWFLLIGEPQSGKTVTLLESGLDFPIGAEAISGAGGSRNCDWWFTEDAVLLDTAGRFSFQEDKAPDRFEWDHFLKLLKKHRRECPINGVLVVIPATSLIEDPFDEQTAKAKNIRKKLFELQKKLEIRFPVYVLITKADRILGFTEFFSLLSPEDKGQILGWSAPDEGIRWNSHEFDAVFSGLVRRMHRFRLHLLHRVNDIEVADQMFMLPEELASIEDSVQHYLHTIFRVSRFEDPLLLRGFYITSGMQEGRPVPWACSDFLRVPEGNPEGVLDDHETLGGRQSAFFLRDLYRKKVFPEKGLVRQTSEAVKKTKRNKRVFCSLIGCGVVAALFLLVPAWMHMSQVLRPIHRLVQQVCIGSAGLETLCPLPETWELVYEFEQILRDLEESKWPMRIFLQGRIKNEVNTELLPTVQALLMRQGVLAPLLESFEARSDPSIWQGDNPFDYVSYLQAFENRLRLDQYQRLSLVQTKADLRTSFTLEPILRFIAERRGYDRTIHGTQIDEWLADASHLGDIEEIEKIFQAILISEERLDVLHLGRLENPSRSRRTLEAYWTVPNLVNRTEEGSPVDGSDAQGGRPGEGIDSWQKNCIQDFEALRQIYGRLISRTAIQEHCQVKLQADYLAWQVSETTPLEPSPTP